MADEINEISNKIVRAYADKVRVNGLVGKREKGYRKAVEKLSGLKKPVKEEALQELKAIGKKSTLRSYVKKASKDLGNKLSTQGYIDQSIKNGDLTHGVIGGKDAKKKYADRVSARAEKATVKRATGIRHASARLSVGFHDTERIRPKKGIKEEVLDEGSNYHSVFFKNDDKWCHHFDADSKEDATSEKDSIRNQGHRTISIVTPKGDRAHNWGTDKSKGQTDPHEFVTAHLKSKGLREHWGEFGPASKNQHEKAVREHPHVVGNYVHSDHPGEKFELRRASGDADRHVLINKTKKDIVDGFAGPTGDVHSHVTNLWGFKGSLKEETISEISVNLAKNYRDVAKLSKSNLQFKDNNLKRNSRSDPNDDIGKNAQKLARRRKGLDLVTDKLTGYAKINATKEEAIHELSKGLLQRYAKSTEGELRIKADRTWNNYPSSKTTSWKAKKRYAGADAAAAKLGRPNFPKPKVMATEETQSIDEVSNKTLKSYMSKAGDEIHSIVTRKRAGYKLPKETDSKLFKRFNGYEKAKSKLKNEDIEHIDEVSKKYLGKYHAAAVDDLDAQSFTHGASIQPNPSKEQRGHLDDNERRIEKRKKYIKKAFKKVSEETIDEGQDGIKKTLMRAKGKLGKMVSSDAHGVSYWNDGSKKSPITKNKTTGTAANGRYKLRVAEDVEEVEIDEGRTYKADRDSYYASRKRAGATSALKKSSKAARLSRDQKKRAIGEGTEQIDELSKKTLDAYINKADDEINVKYMNTARTGKQMSQTSTRKYMKRDAGQNKAIQKVSLGPGAKIHATEETRVDADGTTTDTVIKEPQYREAIKKASDLLRHNYLAKRRANELDG
jgi:hypothetical protein